MDTSKNNGPKKKERIVVTQNEKDLLARFAESTNKAITELTSLMTIAADHIAELKDCLLAVNVRLTDKEEMDEAINNGFSDRLHNLEKFNDDKHGVWSKYQRNKEGEQ